MGDDHATLTTELRRWIARRNVIMVHDDWVSGIGETFSASRSPATRAEAVQSMIGQGIDYIVVAEVLEWTTYPEYDSQLVGIVQLLNGNDGSVTREFRLAMPEVIRVASSQPDSNSDSPQMSDDDSPAPSSVTPRQPSETAPDEALADFAVRPNTLTSGIATPSQPSSAISFQLARVQPSSALTCLRQDSTA